MLSVVCLPVDFNSVYVYKCVHIYLYCSKQLREHFKHASDLDEWIIQVGKLYWCTLFTVLRTKWSDNGQWKPQPTEGWIQNLTENLSKKFKSQTDATHNVTQ